MAGSTAWMVRWMRNARVRRAWLGESSYSTMSSQPSKQHDASVSMMVSEMFASVQGEGPNSGRPSVFLRLGLCNLECAWCDTKYTWLFKEEQLRRIRADVAPDLKHTVGDRVFDRKGELQKLGLDQVIAQVNALGKSQISRAAAVVITGGEPLVHKPQLTYLVPALLDHGYEVEFETNGTLSPRGIPVERTVHFNVSPKLRNAAHGNTKQTIKPDVLREFVERGAAFKFVIQSPNDVDEVLEVLDASSVPRARVFLMPQGKTHAELAERGAWVAELCVRHGLNYSHRVHVALWGDKRGV
ncbi:7-carboxy-7-deazaguanine synthase [Porphyridium purpureum]|uniref:7-carboxy-7-deazaguanine synthase n=1 Tax=Porphyridium purpureum TaxID=35688 RepID=A0A5J4Z430_PORPP|nr:7-carboxy-7-deazaguanine synthase [Porphyridium purpureum]|eukprot:POR8033..scf295_1